ncbi:sensor histidine kinase [Paenibacillus sinopodophylli]|uniref:sensor histidine kinase n=1 Tax=Paenibacillus sinopodophylli TaxID=1837342 RepID=UPI00110CF433|nr:HAMP domain-containing sensor histidine kinase [Paenibacillus sinopodophylli]
MLLYFIALFMAGVIVYVNNPKSGSNRWAAYFLAAASVGGLADLISGNGHTFISHILQFINYTVTPYCILIFSFIYTNRLKTIHKKDFTKLYFAIPILLMLIAMLLSISQQRFFQLLLLWSAPYYLLSCYLLIHSFWRERDSRLRRNRFITTVIIVPTLLAVLFFIYVAKVISPEFEFFNYISVFIIYSLAAALLFTFMYGVLGVRLRFEHDPMESTMRAVSSGAALLNHTIKNEVGKISISTENLNRILLDSNEQSKQHTQIITNATNHLLDMMDRIQSQIKDIRLQEKPVRLRHLVKNTLNQHNALLVRQNITIHSEYLIKPVIQCDPVHISEAIGNLLMNASEAMPQGGLIKVRLAAHKNSVELSIQDSGAGIPADKLSLVFDPFFSSGKTGRNFGLGLSYVYNVIQKSGARVTLTSELGKGTRVTLLWPKRKVVRVFEGGDGHEHN